jgi:transglutaminase-like putative cysteine protease
MSLRTAAPARPEHAPARPTPTQVARGGSSPGIVLPLLVALAAASACIPISVLFTDAVWAGPALLVVAVVVGTGALLRATRTPLALVPVAQTAAFLLVAAWTAPPPTEPGAGGVLAPFLQYRDAVAAGIAEVRTTVAPAASTPGLVALVMLLVFLAALILETLAVGLAQPGLGGLVLLVAAIVPLGIRPVASVLPLLLLPAVSWLAMVAADQSARLAAWRPVGQDGRRAAGRSSWPSAVPLGAAVLVLAAVAAVVVAPSLTTSAWLRSWYGSVAGGASEPRVDPVVDVGSSLSEGAEVDVLRYRSSDSRPHYLRLVTLESFDGTQWRPYPLLPGTSIAQVRPGRVAPDSDATVELNVATLSNPYLPLPDGTSRAEVDPGQQQWGWDVQTGDAVSNQTTASGLRISAEVVDTEPSPDVLRAAPSSGDAAGAQNLFVPSSVPAEVGELAREVTRGATTGYDRAVALQEWFTGGAGFRYALEVPDPGGRDPLLAFLQDRVGFCQQYATAMAVMARELGIPARLVVGFTGGRPDNTAGGFVVGGRDAHVWPELWFDGIGWVRFEPTPGGAATVSPPAYSPQTNVPVPDSEQSEVPTVSADPQAPSAAPQPQTPGTTGQAGGIPGWMGAVLAGLGAAALAAAPAWWRRRQRATRLDAAAGGDARSGWQEVLASAVDGGVPAPEPAQTIRAVSERLADALGQDPEPRLALERLGGAAEESAFGPGGASGSTLLAAPDLLEDVRTVLAALDGLRRPWYRRVLPRSLRRAPSA